MKKALVQCETSDGLFNTELAVTITSTEGKVSLFADKSLVKDDKGAHYLIVNLVKPVNEQRQRILLPTESFEKGSRWVDVSSTLVRDL